MSLQRQGRKRIKVEKAHNKERIPMLSVMEPNYRPDGSVTYLKVPLLCSAFSVAEDLIPSTGICRSAKV